MTYDLAGLHAVLGDKDRAFIHFRTDHGLQATITDPLTPILNAQSDQPQYARAINPNMKVSSRKIIR